MNRYRIYLILISFLLNGLYLSAQQNKTGFLWNEIGNGVNYMSCDTISGNNIFIGFAGWTVKQDWTNNWIEHLYLNKLADIEVKYLYSVKGPKDVGFESTEVETTKLAKHITDLCDSLENKKENYSIYMAAHSSGAYVAHHFLNKIYTEKINKNAITDEKIIYFCLDGDIGASTKGTKITKEIIDKLLMVYGVYAYDNSSGEFSPNYKPMQELAFLHPEKTAELVIDAIKSGCTGKWCIHEVLINQKPHNKDAYDLENDYNNITNEHPVNTDYIDYAFKNCDSIILALPTDKSTDMPNQINFFWNKYKDALYRFEIALSPNFERDSLILVKSTEKTNLRISGLENNKRYYWRVFPVRSEAEVSETRWFETKPGKKE